MPEPEADSSAPPAESRPSRARLWACLILGGVVVMMVLTAVLVLDIGRETPDSRQEQQAASSPADEPTSGESELVRLDAKTEPANPPRPAAPPEAPWLPEDRQVKVNEAIDRGVAWLRKNQAPEGYWAGPGDPLPRTNPVGIAALPALTLLECGVAAADPQVARAVELARAAVPQMNRTYELSLAILLLDRLHKEEDRPRIRTMILRLAAGQQANGGWNYYCPLLEEEEELALSTALEKTRPSSSLDLFQQGEHSGGLGLFVRGSNADGEAESGIVKKLEPLKLAPATPLRDDEKPLPKELSETERDKLLHSLPARLRRVPALQAPSAFSLRPGDADNSNTQFAILALLVAPRYDVALERTLALVVQRFHAEQRADGLWTYGEARPSRPRPSMTGAGLLGLAVKYGLVLNSSRHEGQAVIIKDAAIDKGLKALSEYIDHPLLWGRSDAGEGEDRLTLYAMWSIERVGALYHLRTINGKEWYPWGVDQLLQRQEGDGAWRVGQFWAATAAIDTCFALLFLRRADFARDLSKKLEFFTEGKALGQSESR